MTINSARIEAAPGRSGDGLIRAKLFNRRLGLNNIRIGAVSDMEINALATGPVPEIGEAVTILLPTGSDLAGVVNRVQGPAFSVSFDPEAIAVAAS
jgi:hypothetical protein